MSNAVFFFSTAAFVLASLSVAGLWLLAGQVDERLRTLDLNDGMSFEIRP
jgi:hypothetical protein